MRKCGKNLPSPCKQGTQTCRGGRWDTQCADEKGPTTDTCNNIDDDCDGRVDNGCPSGQNCVTVGNTAKCSAPLPSGSYRNSCDGCSYDGVTLSCDACKNGVGVPRATSVRQCSGGQSIVNCDGTLGCRDPSSVVMRGSYFDTCTGCMYDECRLHCTACEDGQGNTRDSTTMDFPCPSGIQNCFGTLKCGSC